MKGTRALTARAAELHQLTGSNARTGRGQRTSRPACPTEPRSERIVLGGHVIGDGLKAIASEVPIRADLAATVRVGNGLDLKAGDDISARVTSALAIVVEKP